MQEIKICLNRSMIYEQTRICHSVTPCWAFVVLVCVGAIQRIPLSALARNSHKGFAHVISHKSGRTMEGRSERRQKSQQKGAEENSQLEIEVQRKTQSAEGGSEKMEAGQRRESTEVKKTTVKTYWPSEAGLTNARRCQHC